MMNRYVGIAAAVAATLLTLAGCGGDGEPDAKSPVDSTSSEQAPESGAETDADSNATADEGATPPADAALDAVAQSFIGTQGSKFSGYEIRDDTIRFLVAEGTTLAGSECLILDSAAGDTGATFVMVEPNGKETSC